MRNDFLATLRLTLAALALGACTGEITGTGNDDVSGEASGDVAEGSGQPHEGSSAAGPMTVLSFTESGADLVNPERGFYVGYNLRGAGDASRIRRGGHSIAIAIVNLEDYRTRALDAVVLASIDAGFDRLRAAGVKVILRFTYNAAFAADASKTQILAHIAQLRPLLQEHADIITVMQAGFIGAWGEWHGSTNGLENDADRGAILDAILAALPAKRGLQVRTPMYKAAYAGRAVDATEAFTGTKRARLGHHNDCFLASASDFGTFASPVDRWTSYVADDGRYTAIGGETCAVYTPKTNCASAIAAMAGQHWSYLNREYNQAVLSAFEAGGCQDEIEQRLGYRFALDRVTHTESVAPGGELALELDLHNSGFASPYNQRPIEIVLSNGTTRHVVRLAGADARRWTAGQASKVTARLRLPADLAAGTYALSLRLPDEDASLAGDARYAIQLANDGLWNPTTGDHLLTRAFTVDAAAPGPRDASATTFAELL